MQPWYNPWCILPVKHENGIHLSIDLELNIDNLIATECYRNTVTFTCPESIYISFKISCDWTSSVIS